MDCRGKVFAMTLTKSTNIYLPKGYEIYKFTDKHLYGSDLISQLDITPPHVHTVLNLTNTVGNEKLSYLSLWDKYSLQFIENRGRVTRFKEAVFTQRVDIDKVSFSSNFGILEFFKNKIVKYITLGIIFIAIAILGFILIKKLLIKLFTEW